MLDEGGHVGGGGGFERFFVACNVDGWVDGIDMMGSWILDALLIIYVMGLMYSHKAPLHQRKHNPSNETSFMILISTAFLS